MELATWGGHVFEITPSVVRGFKSFILKANSETEDKEKDKQTFVSRKKGGAMEINLSVTLNIYLGCDVETEAKEFIEDARTGRSDWFYIRGEKLTSAQFMLTDASCEDLVISPTGQWISCTIACIFKQSSNMQGTGSGSSSSGSSSGGGSSGGSSSGTKTTTKSTTKTSLSKGETWRDSGKTNTTSSNTSNYISKTVATVSSSSNKTTKIMATVKKAAASKLATKK